jgi:hypothetical protein
MSTKFLVRLLAFESGDWMIKTADEKRLSSSTKFTRIEGYTLLDHKKINTF